MGKAQPPRMAGWRALSTCARGYDEALEKLATLASNRGTTRRFGQGEDLNARAMGEMDTWLRRAGYGRDDLARIRHLHVAGTKGKGSVCAFATAMLRRRVGDGAGGGGVGTYTSPHLVSPRERIAVDGEPLGQREFADAVLELWARFGDAARREGRPDNADARPFYFRFLTILAWHVFLARGLAHAVVECGIGGEYDATNVLPPAAVSASVLAPLAVDHAAMLGRSVEAVAWHKAGIMKPGVRCFAAAPPTPAAARVLRRRAAERRAPLVLVGDAAVRRWGGQPSLLRGDFQATNQALAALAVREHLGLGGGDDFGDDGVLAALRRLPPDLALGLREARLRGRCELLDRPDVTWLLDGAHTPDSLAATARWLASLLRRRPPEPVVLVFNQQDRAPAPLLVALVAAGGPGPHVFRHALFTRGDLARPPDAGPADMAVQRVAAAAMAALVPTCDAACVDNVTDALARAAALAPRIGDEHHVKPKVLVTGSLHLVGAALRVLEPDSPL